MSHGFPLSVFFLPFWLLVFFSLVVFLLVGRQKRRSGREAGLPVPPGSMGLPWIGETHQFYSEDPNVFFASRQKRYGEIFKTHLLGCPCVMLASPEAARFVLVTQAHLFKPTYPKSKETMIGPWALFFHQGRIPHAGGHPPACPDIDTTVVSMLESWDGRSITTFHEMKKLSFDIGILTIFGRGMEEQCKEELKKNYYIVDKGYNSLPNRLPGTLYSKAIVARQRIGEILRRVMKERRRRGNIDKDLLGVLMGSLDGKGNLLSDDQIADNIIGVLFAAQDTTASALTWILKYLHDNSKVLEAVKAEQMSIYRSNEGGANSLTWAQTRSMPLTQRVILESLRMASIISFTFREAVADVEYKGYLIPKGWKVMPLFRNIHHNPEFFHDPEIFDASRFTASPKPNTFLPFGNGVHACPGNELAKLEMVILIHHLVTKYRWEILGSRNETEYGPFPIPKRGLPARFFKISSHGDEHHKT
ncbi:unnamed protein product [Spirodela intermedia]|uniref:(+)-abscisic acid 8'-hydroxylase n=1 Tax=Spirodela intermedia TaxID=51605 RepID=A0A7I8J417_SPIIN|nr:unnamed protein product [Spirodela intermedia]CAA6664967.1 unnamed protein product [Spirodela intermedia]